MLPNREGRFKATIMEHGVSETGPNNLATFVCKFQLIQELGNGQWNPVDEDLDITGYFYLEKRDGSLNTVTIEALKSAFGWDGRDPLWLQDSDFSGDRHVVQVKLAFEQYQGKTRLKVQYIDAEDSTGRPGGVPRADDNTRRALANRLGAKLRANAPGSPAPAPKPAGRPAPPTPARPKPAPTPLPAKQPFQPPAAAAAPADRPQTPGVNADAAWVAFLGNFDKPDVDPKLIEGEWFRILGDMFPGRDARTLSSAEWTRFITEAPAKIIPF